MDEAKLIKRLKLIEALFAGATTEGERIAAERARQRILERLSTTEREDPPVEYRFSMPDLYARRVFVALCRRYGLEPYRYKRQRYTTVMLRVSERFVDETLWPQYKELSDALHSHLLAVTTRVVGEVLHGDSSEATVVEEGASLPGPRQPPSDSPPPSATPPAASPKPAAGANVDKRRKQKQRRNKRKKGKRR